MPAGPGLLVRRQRGGEGAAHAAGGRRGRPDQAQPGEAAGLLSTIARIRTTSRASRNAPSSARARPTPPGRPINWMAPAAMYEKLYGLCRGAMKGRTMYVVPYLMGLPGSPLTKVGVEITDSIYVVLSMRIMTRMGQVAWDQLGDRAAISPRACTACSTSIPSAASSPISRRTTRSSRSARTTAATCCSGRSASRCGSAPTSAASRAGWRSTCSSSASNRPTGEKTYVAAAFPSACGKTNFAMLIPPKHFEGWKITTVGDDIAWMRPGPDGRLYAINPGGRLLRRRAGHEFQVEPERDDLDVEGHDLHQRRAHARRRCLVGRQGRRAARGVPRLEGQPVDARLEGKGGASRTAASPRRWRTIPRSRPRRTIRTACRSARIIFGGRRATTLPLVFQAFNWIHGVYVGATMGSETTAAAAGRGRPGAPRSDGDAALLRLQHGRLFPALAAHAQDAQASAEGFSRELVSQERGRQIPLARLRRKHARAEMDRRPLPRPRARLRNARRLDARAGGHRHQRPRRLPAGESRRGASRSISRNGSAKCCCRTSSSSGSTPTCPRN